uniref:Uncharacterized protein n=1 Tax=Knipowitschia caucasica TaxID=637954 RepID=A0AAV2L842_KNICA
MKYVFSVARLAASLRSPRKPTANDASSPKVRAQSSSRGGRRGSDGGVGGKSVSEPRCGQSCDPLGESGTVGCRLRGGELRAAHVKQERRSETSGRVFTIRHKPESPEHVR